MSAVGHSLFYLPLGIIDSLCSVIVAFPGHLPQGYKTFFMLNSAEHEFCPANKSQITNNCKFFLDKHS